MSAFDDLQFWNPKSRGAVCYNPLNAIVAKNGLPMPRTRFNVVHDVEASIFERQPECARPLHRNSNDVRVTPEWVTAAASGATLVVVAVAAFAALRQMAHMRVGNQVALFAAYNTEWDSPEFSNAYAFVRSLSIDQLEPQTLEDLAHARFVGDFHKIRLIANFFEDVGAFVQVGILPKSLVCMLYGGSIVELWQKLSPLVYFSREIRGVPDLWEHFEYIAVVSEDFTAAHPHGVFPHGLRRMPIDDSVLKRYRGSATVPSN